MTSEQRGNDVELKELGPQPTIMIRATIPVADLEPAIGDRLSALSAYLRKSGARPAGPLYVRYHTFGETETDLETGIPVTEPAGGEGRVVAGELLGGPTISTWHTGPHEKLGDAYARIEGWLKEHGREPRGPAWEVYYWIDLRQGVDPSNWAANWDPSSWHTQLVQPVK